MASRYALGCALVAAASLVVAPHAYAQNVKLERTVTFSQLATQPSASDAVGNETRQGPAGDQELKKLIRGSISPARVPSAHVPTPNDLDVTGAGGGFTGF